MLKKLLDKNGLANSHMFSHLIIAEHATGTLQAVGIICSPSDIVVCSLWTRVIIRTLRTTWTIVATGTRVICVVGCGQWTEI